MNGKIVGGFIVMSALIVGAAIYYLQVYAYYQPVVLQAGHEIRLTPIASEAPEAIVADNFQGIDADSSPLRFRGCFTTPLSLGMLTETYQTYEKPDPLIAPGWFDCFNAQAIGAALQTGEAVAFLSEHVSPGVDRVIAVFPDGRAFAWHQLNGTPQDASE